MSRNNLVQRHHDVVAQETLRDEYLMCRTVMHSWVHAPARHAEKPQPENGCWRFTIECTRCGMIRYDVLDKNDGELVSRSYDPPTDYKLDERVTRSEMRAEWGKRNKFGFIRARRS